MKKIFTIAFFLFSTSAFAEQKFEIKNASSFFDIKVTVEKCEEDTCSGKAEFSFYKKNNSISYQTINLPDTAFDLDAHKQPVLNKFGSDYDSQALINIGDFNFDGMEDIALCTGNNGSYSMPSYSIYLSSKAAHKFVYNNSFSKLGVHLGMFEVDKTKKVLRIFDKDGCCWHVTQEYTVVSNKPVKVLEIVEDAIFEVEDRTKVKVTTKTLVNGKWKTKIKFIPRSE